MAQLGSARLQITEEVNRKNAVAKGWAFVILYKNSVIFLLYL